MNKQPESQEADRVRRNTDPEVLNKIDNDLEKTINYYATQSPSNITLRIRQLENEWDMERILETNASTLALTGAFMGLVSSKKWFLLTGTVLGFLLQHALSGWCPPVPIFRKMGVRTRSEIDREKYALKVLRGDFKDVPEHVAPNDGGAVDQVVHATNT
ncbi:DUF2892 domain-containing protein [bacterium]|nr:DUF2892 domain-containing protein [bacterium]